MVDGGQPPGVDDRAYLYILTMHSEYPSMHE